MVLSRKPHSHPYSQAAPTITTEKLPLITVVTTLRTLQVSCVGWQSQLHPLSSILSLLLGSHQACCMLPGICVGSEVQFPVVFIAFTTYL